MINHLVFTCHELDAQLVILCANVISPLAKLTDWLVGLMLRTKPVTSHKVDKFNL